MKDEYASSAKYLFLFPVLCSCNMAVMSKVAMNWFLISTCLFSEQFEAPELQPYISFELFGQISQQ